MQRALWGVAGGRNWNWESGNFEFAKSKERWGPELELGIWEYRVCEEGAVERSTSRARGSFKLPLSYQKATG